MSSLLFMSLPLSFNDDELIQPWLMLCKNDRKVSRKFHHPQVAVPLCHRLVKALDNDLHSQHVESKICHHDLPLHKRTMILLLHTPACSHTIQMIRSALNGPSSGKDPVYLQKHSAHKVPQERPLGVTEHQCRFEGVLPQRCSDNQRLCTKCTNIRFSFKSSQNFQFRVGNKKSYLDKDVNMYSRTAYK